MRQRRFTKKADSLDIDRYGLWGDAPHETLFYLCFLLFIGAIIIIVTNPVINPPPTEFQLLSVKELYPMALESVQNEYDNVSLRGIYLSIWPTENSHTPEINYLFQVNSPSRWAIVTIEVASSGYKIFMNEREGLIFPTRTDIQLDKIPFDSIEAFEMLNDRSQFLWKYPFISFPLELWLGRSPRSEFPLAWSIIYRGGGPSGLMAILTMNQRTGSNRIILKE